MRQTLSSGQTLLMKLVLPVLWIAGFAAATVLLFTADGPAPPPLKWLVLGVAVAGGLSWYSWGVRLKRVAIDDEWLYASNYAREVRIALRDIDQVSENRWVNIRPVTVSFRRDTGFGHRIIFMPPVRWWGFWHPHPVVRELEAAARRARGLPPAQPRPDPLS